MPNERDKKAGQQTHRMVDIFFVALKQPLKEDNQMNRMKVSKLMIVLATVFLVSGCMYGKKRTQVEIFDQYASISLLDKAIFSAKGSEVDLYNPEGFSKAQDLLTQSIGFAQEGKKDKAVETSGQGLEMIRNANADAENTKKEMWEITDYRTRAIKAGAPDLFKEEFQASEKKFRKIAALIVSGDVQKARDNQPELIEKYTTLESGSREKGVIELAKVSFEQAKKEGANTYAPKSFKHAQKELGVALSIIEADHTQTAKANEHAELASVLAKNASQISAVVQTFERRDFTNEDIVLWYWQQLEKINAPFGDTVNFNQPNHIVVTNIQMKIADLKQSYQTFLTDSQDIEKKQQDYIETLKNSHEMELAQLNNELDGLKKKYKLDISEQQKIQAKKDRQELELKQRFAFVQSLFNESEAQVFRKGDNVLISAQGFYFPSGDAEIQSSNFGLLNKILSSINQFKDARVEIDGHTDSVGPADLNFKLADKRAENVASFIANVGHIPEDRITHKGYGDEKPLASNKTKEGRTQNRRIEVMIINE